MSSSVLFSWLKRKGCMMTLTATATHTPMTGSANFGNMAVGTIMMGLRS